MYTPDTERNILTIVVQLEAMTATVQITGSEKGCEVPGSLEKYARIMASSALFGTTSPDEWRVTGLLQKGKTTQFFFDRPLRPTSITAEAPHEH